MCPRCQKHWEKNEGITDVAGAGQMASLWPGVIGHIPESNLSDLMKAPGKEGEMLSKRAQCPASRGM